VGKAAPRGNVANLQIFGDFYLSDEVAKQINAGPDRVPMFAKTAHLLSSANINVINFEGAATVSLVPFTLKRHLLRMPVWVPQMLRNAGVAAVTLGNNHAMDFGYEGLAETIETFRNVTVETFGAGHNLADAARPFIAPFDGGAACLISMSRTWPEEFWATTTKPGTAFLGPAETARAIADCARDGYFTIAIFHWGQELTRKPQQYQIELAHIAVDAGADAVIGHHPHIIQDIEVYRGKPIIFSIGNFAFATDTRDSPQEGMAVRIYRKSKGQRGVTFEIVPLNVQNSQVKFVPKLYGEDEENPVAPYIPLDFCQRKFSAGLRGLVYRCNFAKLN
jgi:poly-gamma-glutamate synthesis protein (capsule biosynthesis protein)